jgi:hypothetical protein
MEFTLQLTDVLMILKESRHIIILNQLLIIFLKVSINFLAEIPESTEVRKSIIDQKLFAEQNKSNKVITLN